MWREGSWQLKDGHYVWVEGGWGAPPAYPPLDMPPPAPRAEVPQSRPGYVMDHGWYEWRDGAYVWMPGRLIEQKPGSHYVDGRMEAARRSLDPRR